MQSFGSVCIGVHRWFHTFFLRACVVKPPYSHSIVAGGLDEMS